MHRAIYDELKRVAKGQGWTTYGAVAPLAGLDMSNPAHRNEIADILCEISTSEHREGRPMLSAVVVRQETGMPGQGFFTLARELGLYSSHNDMAFFSEELAKVHREWKDS